jgi:hypothetical protein
MAVHRYVPDGYSQIVKETAPYLLAVQTTNKLIGERAKETDTQSRQGQAVLAASKMAPKSAKN